MLTLNLNLLWTVVNVIVLFLLLRKFLYKPVMDIIAKRQQQADAVLAEAHSAEAEAKAALDKAEAKLSGADAEAAARLAEGERKAEDEKQRMLAAARTEADKIVSEGKAQAEAERAETLRAADAEAAALAKTMCEKLLARSLSEQDSARMLDELMQKAGGGENVDP